MDKRQTVGPIRFIGLRKSQKPSGFTRIYPAPWCSIRVTGDTVWLHLDMCSKEETDKCRHYPRSMRRVECQWAISSKQSQISTNRFPNQDVSIFQCKTVWFFKTDTFQVPRCFDWSIHLPYHASWRFISVRCISLPPILPHDIKWLNLWCVVIDKSFTSLDRLHDKNI